MEKALFNQVGEVKGKALESEDSFSFQFTPQNENLKRTRGALFTLVTVTDGEGDKLAKAKAFYHAFQSSYYAKASGSIINGLSETLDHVDQEFSQKQDDGTKFSLVAAVFWGAVLYLAKSGASNVFVSRAGKLKKLDFNKVASGVLEDQDTVCLSTDKFAQSLDSEELAEILGVEKFETALERLDKKIVGTPGAVCDVIRLSVNGQGETTQEVEIGQVDSEGNLDSPSLDQSPEIKDDEKNPEPEKAVEAGSQIAAETPSETRDPALDHLPASPQKPNKLIEIKDKVFPIINEKFNSLVAFIAKPWKKHEPGEHVDHVAVRRQRLVQIVAVIVLVLVISLSFGLLTSSTKKTTDQTNAFITSAQNSLKEAKNIQTIDPIRAKTLVEQAQKNTAEAKKITPKDSRIASLETQEAELLAEITRSYSFDKLEVFADLTKISKDTKINRLGLGETEILATDSENNTVFSIDLNSETATKIDQAFKSPANLTGYPAGFYVQTEEGVTKIDKTGKASSIATNANWGQIAGAANYQSNLYLLDTSKNEIWRYLATSSGLGTAKAYLQGDKPDLDEATGITIDSFVWVVTKKGTIYKFASGKKQEFSLSNMSESFSNAIDIYTNDTARNIYILDSGKARLVVVSKDGVYQSQYNNDQLHQATSVVVREDQKTAYVSVNGKILTVNLK